MFKPSVGYSWTFAKQEEEDEEEEEEEEGGEGKEKDKTASKGMCIWSEASPSLCILASLQVLPFSLSLCSVGFLHCSAIETPPIHRFESGRLLCRSRYVLNVRCRAFSLNKNRQG